MKFYMASLRGVLSLTALAETKLAVCVSDSTKHAESWNHLVTCWCTKALLSPTGKQTRLGAHTHSVTPMLWWKNMYPLHLCTSILHNLSLLIHSISKEARKRVRLTYRNSFRSFCARWKYASTMLGTTFASSTFHHQNIKESNTSFLWSLWDGKYQVQWEYICTQGKKLAVTCPSVLLSMANDWITCARMRVYSVTLNSIPTKLLLWIWSSTSRQHSD